MLLFDVDELDFLLERDEDDVDEDLLPPSPDDDDINDDDAVAADVVVVLDESDDESGDVIEGKGKAAPFNPQPDRYGAKAAGSKCAGKAGCADDASKLRAFDEADDLCWEEERGEEEEDGVGVDRDDFPLLEEDGEDEVGGGDPSSGYFGIPYREAVNAKIN